MYDVLPLTYNDNDKGSHLINQSRVHNAWFCKERTVFSSVLARYESRVAIRVCPKLCNLIWLIESYRSGTVNSKSFVNKVLL